MTLRGRDPSPGRRRAVAARCAGRPTRWHRCRQPGPIDGLDRPSPGSAPRPATSPPRRVPRRHGSDGRGRRLRGVTRRSRQDQPPPLRDARRDVREPTRTQRASVSATPLVARRQGNDRRADQRVPEGESRRPTRRCGRCVLVRPRRGRRAPIHPEPLPPVPAGRPYHPARRSTASRSSVRAAPESGTRTRPGGEPSAAGRPPG